MTEVKLLKIKDIMEKYQIGERTVYNWIAKGMPVIKKEGVIRFNDADVWEWFTNGK